MLHQSLRCFAHFQSLSRAAVAGSSSAKPSKVDLLVFASALLFLTSHASQAQFSQTEFSQQGSKLVGTGTVGARIYQGAAVSLSSDGNTALVGALEDNSIGAAWVFTRGGGVWTQQGNKLFGKEATNASMLGRSVALSSDGNTALIGGWGDNDYRGAVWVFTRNSGVWVQQGSKLVGTGAVDPPLSLAAQQGASVALSSDGNTAIFGGPVDNNGTGAAWVFTRSNFVWTQQGSKLVGTGQGPFKFGSSVALSSDGNTALVGAPMKDQFPGGAFVFTRSGGVWTQQGNELVGIGVSTNFGLQGASVALSSDGNTALIGAPGDSGIGAIFVFTRNVGVWTQQGGKLSSGGVGTQLGSSVALSSDGNTALVGGMGDNSKVGGAWVFTRHGDIWSQRGGKLVGTGAVSAAQQGTSVALSSDATTALVGGQYDARTLGATWVYTERHATKVCSPFSPNTWRTITPVPSTWTIDDCVALGPPIQATSTQLGCYFDIGQKSSWGQSAAAPNKPTAPDLNCGWK